MTAFQDRLEKANFDVFVQRSHTVRSYPKKRERVAKGKRFEHRLQSLFRMSTGLKRSGRLAKSAHFAGWPQNMAIQRDHHIASL
jgi:hypothetical protein